MTKKYAFEPRWKILTVETNYIVSCSKYEEISRITVWDFTAVPVGWWWQNSMSWHSIKNSQRLKLMEKLENRQTNVCLFWRYSFRRRFPLTLVTRTPCYCDLIIYGTTGMNGYMHVFKSMSSCILLCTIPERNICKKFNWTTKVFPLETMSCILNRLQPNLLLGGQI